MKTYTALFILLAAWGQTIAQVDFPINSESKEIEFVRIVHLDSTSKKDNFNKSKLWVVNVFKSAKDVIQYENSEGGEIVCKGLLELASTGMGMNGTIHTKQAGSIYFSLELAAKDNKCRIKIYELVHNAEYPGGKLSNVKPDCGGMVMTVKTWNSIQQQALDRINKILNDFEASMKQSKSKDEW